MAQTNESPALPVIRQQLDFNAWMFNTALSKIGEEQSGFKAHANIHAFNRIAAHLLISRHGMAQMLDLRPEPLPWKDLGEGMEAGFVPNAKIPPLTELLSEWNKVSAVVRERVGAVPAAVLERPSPFPLPGNPNATLGDLLPLLAIHEGYHLGQLGLALKALTGKSSIMSPPK